MTSKRLQSNPETTWWLKPGRSSTAFDEDGDDRPAALNTTLSSSMNTSLIDGFRQGVEISTWRHWTQGLIKIHAGEPGHVVKPENYGLRETSISERILSDKCQPLPATFISGSMGFSHRLSYLIPTVPPVALDRPSADRFLLDGVIDVLNVRNVELCHNTDMPVDVRGVRGAVMVGNLDESGSSDLITTFIAPALSSSFKGFKDAPETFGDRWPNNRRQRDVAAAGGFVDRRLIMSEETLPNSALIVAVLAHVTGSADYVPPGERVASAGWTNDDGLGTDSIAFGGLSY